MSDPILGTVIGNDCPHCTAEVEIGERFTEGDEVRCSECGRDLFILTIDATYTITLQSHDTVDILDTIQRAANNITHFIKDHEISDFPRSRIKKELDTINRVLKEQKLAKLQLQGDDKPK